MDPLIRNAISVKSAVQTSQGGRAYDKHFDAVKRVSSFGDAAYHVEHGRQCNYICQRMKVVLKLLDLFNLEYCLTKRH